MTTYTFTSAFDAAAAIAKKEGGLWNNLAGAVASLNYASAASGEEARELVKRAVEIAEKEYQAAHPKLEGLGKISAYRSAKSVVLAAVLAGIPLVDENGKARGKSAVEEDIKAGKVDKSPMEKFRITHASMASIADKLLTEMEVLQAVQLLEETQAKLLEFYKSIHAEAA